MPADAARLVTSTPEALTRASAEALAHTRAAIERLVSLPRGTPAAQVLEAYDAATLTLSDAGARASVVRNAHPDGAMRQAAEAAEQQVEALTTELSLDRRVYDALCALDVAGEDAATRRWHDKLLRDFRRAGVDRDAATRARLRVLNEELVRIGQDFDRNIREDVRTVRVPAAALEGLPEDYRRAHPPGPDGRVTLTTDGPDYVPFLTYARDGAAREALWRAYRLRGHPRNREVLHRLVARRGELAGLLGYPHWAAYVTEDKMIRSADAAAAFLERVARASEARMARDHAELLARKRRDDPAAARVEPWDQAYLEDRLRAEAYAFDSQEVRPYLEVGRVKQGLLELTARLFALTYQRLDDAPVWHPDVEAYAVHRDGVLLGRFFLDMHPREGKYKHAAQFTLTTGKRGVQVPEAVLVCNVPRPGAAPALLLHSDVETLFHEFGHLLHHLLGGHTRWAGLSGVRTEWDFVEAPSQLLEEWAWEPEALQAFARHVETDAPLPADVVLRMRRADALGKGLWVRQQLFYAALSLELYRRDPATLDATALVRELQARFTPFPYVEGTHFHLSFGHLDGYSAIYYTYMWSLVIAKDLLTEFRRHGLLSPVPARAYRERVLAPGGSRDAADLVQAFLGRPWSFDAFAAWLDAA